MKTWFSLKIKLERLITWGNINKSHHMGNAWVFPSISHSTGKCNKAHCMRRNGKLLLIPFPIVWVLFPCLIPITWYTSSHPSKHINVESTLKQRWSSTFINVVSTLIFGWKWKLSRRTFIDVVSTLTKQRWNNVDRVTLIQCWWPNVVSTLILGWKGKLSQRMFIGVEKTALKQLCQYLLYWGSLESGSIIKQN